jgi:hypothetical protein
MSDPDAVYNGFIDTDTARSYGGLDKQDDVKNRVINMTIKGVQKFLNREGVATYDNTTVPDDLKLACAHIVGSSLMAQFGGGDSLSNPWRRQLNIGMMFLATFLKTDPDSLTKRYLSMFMSEPFVTGLNQSTEIPPYIQKDQPW